jgi:hypothetical protein
MIKNISKKLKEEGQVYFGKYDTFWHRFSFGPWHWGMSLCKFEDNWSLHLFCFWIDLWEAKTEPREIMDKYGIDYYPEESYLSIGYGERSLHINMPWSYDHCIHEVMLDDGTFVVFDGYKDSKEAPENMFRILEPYTYKLKSREIQIRMATVTVDRRSWCWRNWISKWFRWPEKVRVSIDVEFNDEVGERTGSWKGGTIGCGYSLNYPHETPLECLRRMEKERIFD